MARSVRADEFERMMLDGIIRDGCTLAAWGLYLLWKARQKGVKRALFGTRLGSP